MSSSTAGGELLADIISTSIPSEVAQPHGRNSFALDSGTASRDPKFAKSASVDIEAVTSIEDDERSASILERENFPVPTEEESRTLRKVADSIPMTAYMLCVVELAERATYYGVNTVFSNFMQYPLPEGGSGSGATPAGTQETPGALGKGEQFSVAIGLLFSFLAYVIPVFGGWVADTKLGRFRTILIGVVICGVSHVIMICGAIPSVLRAGNGIAPFMVSLILLAIGAGELRMLPEELVWLGAYALQVFSSPMSRLRSWISIAIRSRIRRYWVVARRWLSTPRPLSSASC